MAKKQKLKKFKVKASESFEFSDSSKEFVEQPASFYRDEIVRNSRPVLYEVYSWNPT
jgi:hypothetical protein